MGQTCSSCTKGGANSGNGNDYSKYDVQKQRLVVSTAEGDDLTRVSVSMSSTTRPLDDKQLGNLVALMQDNQEMMLGTPTAPDAAFNANDAFGAANAGQPIQTRGSMYEISDASAMQFQTVNAKPQLNTMGSTVDALMDAPAPEKGHETHAQKPVNDGGDSDLDTESESETDSESSSGDSSDDSEYRAMKEQMAQFQAQIQSQMKNVEKDTSLNDREKEQKKKVVRQQSLYKWSHNQLRATQHDMERQLALLSKQLGGGADPSSIQAIMAQRKKEQEEAHITPMTRKKKHHHKKKQPAQAVIAEGDGEEEDDLA